MIMAHRTANWTAFDFNTASNNGCCLPRLKRNWNRSDLPTDTSFQFGPIFERHRFLLEFVFEYLDATDLHVACLVNENWNWVATRELAKRAYLIRISCYYEPILCKIESNSPRGRNDESCFILAYDYTRMLENFQNVCLHGADTERITFADYIHRELISSKSNYGVIGCNPISHSNTEDENLSVLYQGLSLPHIPNIRTVIFHCSTRSIHQLVNVISRDEEPKCMLILTSGISTQGVDTCLINILGRIDDRVAMGGGSVDSATDSRTTHNPNSCGSVLCIGFMERRGIPADFNAYSIVMHRLSQFNLATFGRLILMLKRNSTLRKHGVVFVFGSMAKVQTAMKLKIIEEKFPNYVIFHINCDDEIGWSTRKTQEVNEGQTPNLATSRHGASQCMQLNRGVRSTVIVLITWGNIQR